METKVRGSKDGKVWKSPGRERVTPLPNIHLHQNAEYDAEVAKLFYGVNFVSSSNLPTVLDRVAHKKQRKLFSMCSRFRELILMRADFTRGHREREREREGFSNVVLVG